MTNIFDGYVLSGARNSAANATTTNTADSGVSRALHTLPTCYPAGQPDLVQARVNQYRASHNGGGAEYLLWAANTSSLALVEESSWAIDQGTVSIPSGTTTVNDPSSPTGTRTDGTRVVILSDNSSRSIAGATTVSYRRGGTTTDVAFTLDVDITFDPISGSLTILDTATTRTATNVPVASPPAASALRGDTLTATYYLAAQRFWWTKNDAYQTRFGWNAGAQRWEPYKGGATVNLGGLLPTGRYVLAPLPTTALGQYLPGSELGDAFATLRIGATPGASSYPVVFRSSGDYSGVLVVSDDLANTDYNFGFTTPPLAGVVGLSSGVIAWNPAFVAANQGSIVWYSPRNFSPNGNGVVGRLTDPDLFIAPVPSPSEAPIIRIGNRAPLAVLRFATEALLSVETIPPGSVGVALSTGWLKFSEEDVAKAQPGTRNSPNPSFDPLWLDADVIYGGLTGNLYPQPVKAPRVLLDEVGAEVWTYTGQEIFIRDATDLPGTGFSGIVVVPDGLGNVPNTDDVGPRPGSSGLVRRLSSGIGDVILFAKTGAATTIITVDFEDQLPSDPYTLPSGTAYVALKKRGGTGSKVVLSSDLRDKFLGQTLYFLQGELIPCSYASHNTLVSKVRDSFTLDGTEILPLKIRVTDVFWLSAALGAGTYTAEQIATSINAAIVAAGGPGTCVAQNGYVIIRSGFHISVGFGTGGEINLSGCIALGFEPGWYTNSFGDHSATDRNWQADCGLEFGVYRSPTNLDGSQGVPDFRNTYRVTNGLITDSIAPSVYQFLDYAPREDIAGYDLGVFFLLSAQGVPGAAPIVQTALKPFDTALYDFANKRFAYLAKQSFLGAVQSPVASVDLGVAGIVPSSFYSALGGALRVSTNGGAYTYLELGSGFLLDGSAAELVTVIGEPVLSGSQGRFGAASGTFNDTTVNFTTSVAPGDRLEIVTGDNTGWHDVTTVALHALGVTPPFVTGDGGLNTSWRILRGVAPGAIDPSVVADVVYSDFDPLPSEPFSVRTLTGIGTAGDVIATLDLSAALASGRNLYLRFGTDGADLPITLLGNAPLGVVGDGLSVPTGTHLTNEAFNLLVGGTVFEQGVGVILVPSFSPDPGATIEYLASGALKFGTTVASNFAGATVVYVATPLPWSAIVSGTAEVDPNNGALAPSSVDISANAGKTMYFVGEMVPVKDIILNPILGTFTFTNPMRAGQLVEVQYYRAVSGTGAKYLVDGQPVLVTEFLPVFIRREVATRVGDQFYTFNPAARTVDPTVAPQVYAGSAMLTYGVPSGCNVNFTESTLSLVEPVDAATRVVISYAVLEAVGGETSYVVSTPPVWRPPFYLAKGQSVFAVSTNRVATLAVGRMLRLGSFVTYISGSVYDATQDITTVTISPTPPTGVGTLAPSDPSPCLLTDRVVTPRFTPGADNGFLPSLVDAYGLSDLPRFDPVPVGQNSIRFEGDLTQYGVAGHILELYGTPFVIAKTDLSADGRYTTFTLTAPVGDNYYWTPLVDPETVRISVRPIYPQGAGAFLGSGKSLDTQPFALVLYGELDNGVALPGRTLVLGRDYNIDPGTGNLTFISPVQDGIGTGQSLRFYRTEAASLSPHIVSGTLVYPRVSASFSSLQTPSEGNGLLGGSLVATYTFEAPDTFYVRVVPLADYGTEVALGIAKTARANSNGPTFSTPARVSNGAQGVLGLSGQRQDLVSQDRVCRVYFNYYNGVVSAFEQVQETLDGNVIGERDGKLRSWVGTNNPWTPPGYEDDISGAINPRNLWFMAWSGQRAGLPPIRLLPTDPVIDPLTATADGDGRPTGTFQNPYGFARLQGLQTTLIKNDIDDVVLLGRTNITRSLAGFIYFTVQGFGDYHNLSYPSALSRLFPERTKVFTTTGPGIGADPTLGTSGVYSAGKATFSDGGFAFASTTGTAIGRLENPTLGVVTNVLGVSAKDRLARARVWGYDPTGYAAVDVLSANRPTLVATVVPIDRFPTLSDTGLPDTSRLASQSGGAVPTGLADLSTGDPTLHTPPFSPGDQIALGHPDGTIEALGYTGTSFSVQGQTRYAGVYVDSVLKGCLLTLRSKDVSDSDVPVTDATTLVVLTGGATNRAFDPQQGDTIVVVPNTGNPLVVSDPPTATELAALNAALPTYRTGTDLDFRSRTGELVDATLPSFSDPTLFGLKEILGQRPPRPLSTLEADVSFQNGNVLPTNIPALSGGRTLDNGDYSNPYYQVENTELTLLGAAATGASDILSSDGPGTTPVPAEVAPYVVEAVYPDEILDNAGALDTFSLTHRATLTTLKTLDPAAAVYPTPGHAGVGKLEPYDLVLVQESTGTLPAGSTGILSVGAISAPVVSGSPWGIEPPRFVAPTNLGTKHTLSIQRLQSGLSAGHTQGVVVTEDTTTPGVVITTFDFTSIPTTDLVLDDGMGGGALPVPVGGYNDFMVLCDPGTKTYINVIQSDGNVNAADTVVITNNGLGANILLSTYYISGDNDLSTVAVNAGGLRFLPQVVEVFTAAPFFDFTQYDPFFPSPGVTQTAGFHDVTLSIYGVGSTTFNIEDDRLTVTGPIDTRTANQRGYTTLAGDPLECRLSIVSNDVDLYNPIGLSFVTAAIDVNNDTTVNGGLPLTFLRRAMSAPTTYGIGWFAAGAGHLKAMAFEGHLNDPISSTGITFSAVPSSRQNVDGAIFNGQVVADEVFDNPTVTSRKGIFTPVATFTGAAANALPGDILTISKLVNTPLPTPNATGKAGTYLVRDVIVANTGDQERRATLTAVAGDSESWLGLAFPVVVSIDTVGAPELTVDLIQPLPPSVSYGGVPVSASTVWGATGRVFLIVSETGLQSDNPVIYAASVFSAAYTGLVGTTFVGLNDFRDGLGNATPSATFTDAAIAGVKVSGMGYAPVSPSTVGIAPNLSGRTDAAASVGNRCFYGFRTVTLQHFGAPLAYAATTAGTLTPATPGTALIINEKVRQAANVFLPPTAPVYDGIPGVLDITNVDWDAIHTPGPFTPAGTRCLLPQDTFTLDYTAQAGIYVEPSFPTTANNLASTVVNVVDAAHSLLTTEVGPRPLGGYLTTPSVIPVGGSLQEIAQCEVRRVRRWHWVNELVSSSLHRLRYAYEIRRGIVSSVSSVAGVCTLTAEPVGNHRLPQPLLGGTATQLGDFTQPWLNLHAGDSVRFLDASGAVLTESEILSIDGALSLTLSTSGITVTPGTGFEIYLRVPPIPQEQSAQELLAFATDSVVLTRPADYTAQTGGHVPYTTNPDPQVAYDQSANTLHDTAGAVFGSVLPGDVVVIDPAGAVFGPTGAATVPEFGRQPLGDNGVAPRGADYTAGGPTQVDDNRGYYWVATVTPTELGVTAQGNLLAGDRTTGDIVFGTSTGYAVYPTIHGSDLSGTGDGIEGQMDLRPTAFAQPGNTFMGTFLSVAPFGYRVIRPSPFLSAATVELILSTRERVLTLVDMLRGVFEVSKGGSYYVFQRDQHIQNLGLTSDFGSGLGLLRNAFLEQITGRTGVTPYANNTACLSILDRRFWGLDYRLDTMHPPYGSTTPYTDFSHGIARPVLPDRINVALDQRDKLRQTRYSWLTLRVNRSTGTMEGLRRFDSELPAKVAEQGRVLLAVVAAEKGSQ